EPVDPLRLEAELVPHEADRPRPDLPAELAILTAERLADQRQRGDRRDAAAVDECRADARRGERRGDARAGAVDDDRAFSGLDVALELERGAPQCRAPALDDREAHAVTLHFEARCQANRRAAGRGGSASCG